MFLEAEEPHCKNIPMSFTHRQLCVTGSFGKKYQIFFLPWKYSSGGRCPYSLQWCWAKWSLKVLSTQIILSFHAGTDFLPPNGKVISFIAITSHTTIIHYENMYPSGTRQWREPDSCHRQTTFLKMPCLPWFHLLSDRIKHPLRRGCWCYRSHEINVYLPIIYDL